MQAETYRKDFLKKIKDRSSLSRRTGHWGNNFRRHRKRIRKAGKRSAWRRLAGSEADIEVGGNISSEKEAVYIAGKECIDCSRW